MTIRGRSRPTNRNACFSGWRLRLGTPAPPPPPLALPTAPLPCGSGHGVQNIDLGHGVLALLDAKGGENRLVPLSKPLETRRRFLLGQLRLTERSGPA